MPRNFAAKQAMKIPLPDYKKSRIGKIAVFGTMEQGNIHNSTCKFEDYSVNRSTISAPGFPKGVKKIFDLVKQTAINHKQFAVNSAQVDMLEEFFIFHKNIPSGSWNAKKFRKSDLKPEDYEIFINPFIEYESVASNLDYEYNASFPQMKSRITRPNIISVKYTNEHMEYTSKMLYGFQARMFLNQWDMIIGKSLIWWYRTLGRVYVREKYRQDFKNLIEIAEKYYPLRINELIKEFPELTKEMRPHDIIVKNGEKWKQFYPDTDIDD